MSPKRTWGSGRKALPPPGYLTVAQVAAQLGCTYRNVTGLIRSGTLPFIEGQKRSRYAPRLIPATAVKNAAPGES